MSGLFCIGHLLEMGKKQNKTKNFIDFNSLQVKMKQNIPIINVKGTCCIWIFFSTELLFKIKL